MAAALSGALLMLLPSDGQADGQSPALVNVTSDPSGAAIYLDFLPIGQVTPAIINVGEAASHDGFGMRLASHVITLKKTGAVRPSPVWVTAVPGEAVTVHFDLVPTVTGTVGVVTTPEGAEVFIDTADTSVGVTPLQVGNLAPGSHTVLLRKAGWLQPRPITAWVEADQMTELNLPLAPTNAARFELNVRSLPEGSSVYIDYLPSGEVTDVVVGWLDAASHAGPASHTMSFWDPATHVRGLWQSASHTVLLRRTGALPLAARYVPEAIGVTNNILVNYADTDGDGIIDADEVAIHDTDPFNPDSDGDGLNDGDEVNVHRTNPKRADSDGDGLSDGDEVTVYLTNPAQADSDGDGYSDGEEVAGSYDPNAESSHPFAVSDFDRDGVSDIATYLASSGTWSVIVSSGTGTQTRVFGYAGTTPFAGDFDGDGQLDYGCYDANGIPNLVTPGTWYITASTAGFRKFVFGYPGTVPVVADYDGDGRADLGLYDQNGIPGLVDPGTWYLMRSTAGFRTLRFGYLGATPVAGDYDGDGRADIAVFDAAGIPGWAYPGTWYLMQSTAGFRTFRFGYPGVVPALGDYDGDGRTDVACYDAAGIPNLVQPGAWYIMQSEVGFRTERYGYAGTVPVVGDFDGDGVVDIGCHDPILGRWYIMQSTDGHTVLDLGGNGAVPVLSPLY